MSKLRNDATVAMVLSTGGRDVGRKMTAGPGVLDFN